MKAIRNTLTAIALGTSIALSGCIQETGINDNGRAVGKYTLETFSVDDYQRNEDGWVIFYTDKNDELQHEKFYDNGSEHVEVSPFPELNNNDKAYFERLYDGSDNRVRVIKDLESGDRGHALVINYKFDPKNGSIKDTKYVEIHVASDKEMSNGSKMFNSKFMKAASKPEAE